MIQYFTLNARTLLFAFFLLHSFVAGAAANRIVFSRPNNYTAGYYHGDVHEQIKKLTQQIKKDRKNPDLYFQRAVLYHEHGTFRRARKDYNRSIKLGYKLPDVYYLLARLYKEYDKNDQALEYIDTFLGLQPASVSGRIERGRIVNQMGKHDAALQEYNSVFASKRSLIPEYYLEAVAVILKRNPKDYDLALQMLDAAMGEIGKLSVFQDSAIELELQKGDVDAAIARLDALAEDMDRKESHYARKADILLRAGRTQQAKAYYQKTLDAIEKMADHRQKIPSVVALKERVTKALKNI